MQKYNRCVLFFINQSFFILIQVVLLHVIVVGASSAAERFALTNPVCLHVALEAALLIETPPADVAAVRLLSGVDPQMSLEVAVPVEGLAAIRAHEGFLGFDHLEGQALHVLETIQHGPRHAVQAGFTRWQQRVGAAV